MRPWHLFIALFIFRSLAFPQIPTIDMNDEFQELEGKLTLHFFNALTGEPISEAEVEIEEVGTFVTDFHGRVFFPIPEEDGFYKVSFSKDGYIETQFFIEITAGTIFFNRISISPALTAGAIRIVLDWDAEPEDLDAHLVKLGSYHISYRDKKVADDKQAVLDRDDTDGYGPETITINKIDSKASYIYFVHNFSHRGNPKSNTLSKSKAHVRVYYAGRLLYNWAVPKKVDGTYWEVFRIEKGNIIPVNKVSPVEP